MAESTQYSAESFTYYLILNIINPNNPESNKQLIPLKLCTQKYELKFYNSIVGIITVIEMDCQLTSVLPDSTQPRDMSLLPSNFKNSKYRNNKTCQN